LQSRNEDMQGFTLREARNDEADILTHIAFSAKRFWNYPEEWISRWRDELTITPEYIQTNAVFVVSDTEPIGFACLKIQTETKTYGEACVEAGIWLDHIFITPGFHAKGLGRLLLAQVQKTARERGYTSLKVFSDPHASGFYEKTGAILLRMSPSSIPDRFIPVFEYIL